MLKTVTKLAKTVRKAARQRRRDGRRHAITQAALTLLALHDQDQVSVAAIAAEAKCSVGAFYSRFPEKNALLRALTRLVFESAAGVARRQLDPGFWKDKPRRAIARQIAAHLVSEASGENAGIFRVAMKLGRTDKEALAAYLAYRDNVTALAVALLCDHDGGKAGSAGAVREAMQMAHAVVLDAALNRNGPLAGDAPRMVEAIAGLIINTLKLPNAPAAIDSLSNGAAPPHAKAAAPEKAVPLPVPMRPRRRERWI